MKRKTRYIALGMLALIGSAVLFPLSAAAEANSYTPAAYQSVLPQTGEDGGITPYADIIDWRYKVMDGYVYRRLYNYSKGMWIGEWELVP